MKFPHFCYLVTLVSVLFSCSKESNTETDKTIDPPIVIDSVPTSAYFPPISRTNEWETVSFNALGWNEENVPSLLNFLEENDTDAFIILKNGRIVLEEYFGDFTMDDNHAWNSAGKNLTAMLTGIAQEEEYLNITDASSIYLGEGWTSLTPEQEQNISIKNQLTMTTGLDYTVDNNFCTDPECLQYLNEPNSNWYYHNAPYTLLDDVIANAVNTDFNTYFSEKIKEPIGMQGTFIKIGYNNVFFSTARSMARFGILNLQEGNWDGTTILNDMDYFNAMTNTSQDLNLAYGYLYWLNGKESFKLPNSEDTFTGNLIPNAPAELYAALGKNDQKLYMVPSMDLVVVRMGGASDEELLGPSSFDNEIWGYIMDIIQQPTP
ncbi:CubicO group peptidase, beta-lactamase class C family [Maribacter sedimenticola]|uniref:CubicO group peptidase, beta-lactamase class C family n=1 Tax=Maribacter sedimenticola TaxID=228956 RepID=A0ABY1SLN4_9FLAO|nr:serine hydrolase [Maribacter sedimenticola]SNR76971.1 CubicO group peptidase, beta-lactamase class C family [Maribacter sedimenticola]